MHWTEEKYIQGYGAKTLNKMQTTLNTQAQMGNKVKMYLNEMGWEGVDCINLAQNRDQ